MSEESLCNNEFTCNYKGFSYFMLYVSLICFSSVSFLLVTAFLTAFSNLLLLVKVDESKKSEKRNQ